jgi:hypothetical protein
VITIENETALCDSLLEIGEGLEVPVAKRLIQDRPEVLGGLQFGRVAGQVDEPDPIREEQVRRGVPARVVEPEHDHALACFEKLLAEGFTPINCWGTPEDVGRAAATMAAGDRPFTTGAAIQVDGGMHIHYY